MEENRTGVNAKFNLGATKAKTNDLKTKVRCNIQVIKLKINRFVQKQIFQIFKHGIV
jgi:hypothetical protein